MLRPVVGKGHAIGDVFGFFGGRVSTRLNRLLGRRATKLSCWRAGNNSISASRKCSASLGSISRELTIARRWQRPGWRGLLIDSDAAKVAEAQRAFRYSRSRHHRAMPAPLRERVAGHRQLLGAKPMGVLSVDVDGNDYWLLREPFALAPARIRGRRGQRVVSLALGHSALQPCVRSPCAP